MNFQAFSNLRSLFVKVILTFFIGLFSFSYILLFLFIFYSHLLTLTVLYLTLTFSFTRLYLKQILKLLFINGFY